MILLRIRSYALGFIAFLAMGCAGPDAPEPISYYCVSNRRGNGYSLDTLAALEHHSTVDSMMGRTTFSWSGTEHAVKGFTDVHYAAVDGGRFMLELDSIGVFYSHNTTWPDNFYAVHTNNDSLNRLISLAFAAALRPEEFGVRYRSPTVDTTSSWFHQLDSVLRMGP